MSCVVRKNTYSDSNDQMRARAVLRQHRPNFSLLKVGDFNARLFFGLGRTLVLFSNLGFECEGGSLRNSGPLRQLPQLLKRGNGFITKFEAVCFRQLRSLPCLYKSSCPCNQRRWFCSRPGPYNRFGLCTRVCPSPRQPSFGGRRQDYPMYSLHRHARRWTQLGGRQRQRRQLLPWMV